MKRVRVIVEGPTEESFVKGPLYSALVPFDVFVSPIIIGVPGRKGGNVTYDRVKGDILRSLKQDATAYCSTLFDLYGLGKGFPDIGSLTLDGSSRADHLQRALLNDLNTEIPQHRPDIRFIPYIQVYEFESLLFSDTACLARGMFREDLKPKLEAIRNSFSTPEDINNSPQTAPSKRILGLNPAYNKVISGVLAAEEIGIDVIKAECPRFRLWFEALAALGTKQ